MTSPPALVEILKLLGSAVLLAGLLLLGRRRFGIAGGVYALLAGVTIVGLSGLAEPWWHGSLARGCPIVLLVLLSGAVGWAPVALWERIGSLASACPALLGYAAPYLLTPLVAFGLCESVTRGFWETGLLPSYSPLVTIVPPGTADFRIFHTVQDQYREPDPVLLWRSLPIAPFSAQGFKGPLVAVPKAQGVVRIICYGDSNTEGRLGGKAWPRRLQALLRRDATGGERYEVMNAGVTGYSSYQGLMRFEQEVETYDPDLVFVSFGWNDASGVSGRPDKEFRPPSAGVAALLRALDNYRSYLLLNGYLSEKKAAAGRQLVPRVSVGDYVANLKGFVAVARAHGAIPVLLTRPHVEAPDVLAPEEAWRRSVPEYNRALRQLARAGGLAMVDVHEALANRADLFVDACHLTEEGHEELAQVLHDSILGILEKRSLPGASR